MKRLAVCWFAMLAQMACLGMEAAQAQGTALPVYQYKRFCQALSKGHAVMARNCEAQEVLSYNQLRTIWQDPPPEKIQDKCHASNAPDRKTGSGSYVKFLNCIITNTGR